MSKMYKSDPNQPRTENINTTPDNKVVELENKVNRLIDQLTKMQTEIDRLTRAVKRHGSDVNGVINKVNRIR